MYRALGFGFSGVSDFGRGISSFGLGLLNIRDPSAGWGSGRLLKSLNPKP